MATYEINNLLDRHWSLRTVVCMADPFDEILIPYDYRVIFSAAEFKFRWLEALMEDEGEWRRASELFAASVLNFYMDHRGVCFPSVTTMARIMRKSPDTTRRALRALEDNGWLIIQHRPNQTSVYHAILPDYGMALLVNKRKRKSEVQTMSVPYMKVNHVLEEVCTRLGIDKARLEAYPENARLVGRLVQIVQRMPEGDNHTEKLIYAMASEPPPQMYSPHGFLLGRANEYARAYGVSGKRRAKDGDIDETYQTMLRQLVDGHSVKRQRHVLNREVAVDDPQLAGSAFGMVGHGPAD